MGPGARRGRQLNQQPTAAPRRDRLTVVAALATAGSAAAHFTRVGSVAALGVAAPVLAFLISAVALAILALLVSRNVEQLADPLGPGRTGVVQAALGNLPELFVGIFALRAGLVTVVQAALVGSVLASVLLLLGMAFVAGGLRHGRQSFNAPRARLTSVQLLLAVAGFIVPTLASRLDSPAAPHVRALSQLTAVVLLAVYALTLPGLLRRPDADNAGEAAAAGPPGGVSRLAGPLGRLTAAALASGAVADWFVAALTPALHSAHVSDTFAGLVVVAIAGNAVENLAGVRLAAGGRPEHAVSAILASPLQIALLLAPLLVLISPVLGGATLTLALPPMLLAALVVAVVVTAVVVGDGESNWLEGTALIAVYIIIAAAFWWG